MNLMESMIAEVNRVKEEVMPKYAALGRAGAIALALMKNTVAKAEKAMGEGDTIAMLSLFKELKEIEL